MEILVILALIALNGFFALAEIAFVSSRREFIETARDLGSRSAARVLAMMDEPDKFLSSIQIGITLIGIVSGAFGGIAISGDLAALLTAAGMSGGLAGDVAVVLVVGIITYLSIVLGELVPKTIGLKNPERIILTVMPAVTVFSILTHPVVALLSWTTKAILRLFHAKSAGIGAAADPLEDILGIAKAAAVKNKISREQEGAVMRAARLQSTRLDQVMVKRSDMRCLPADMSLADSLVVSHIHHHTRFPLIDPASGDIIGYANFKDIINSLRITPADPSLRGICRPMVSFRKSDTINSVLRRLISAHQHIALVRDEDKKVEGMVTLEDILETVVGDIQDEYGIIPDHLYEISPGRYIAGGGVTIRRLQTVVGGLSIGDDRSIDLWIRENLGAAIKPEMTMRREGLALTVRKVSRSHVYEVIIEKVGS
jgi:putative hemolysin